MNGQGNSDLLRFQVTKGKLGIMLFVKLAEEPLDKQIQLYTLSGKMTGSYLTKGNNASPIQINTSSYTSGIYVVRLIAGKISYQKPVLLFR
jgi:hypothetical protein